jgi:hypothetical protein
VLSSGYLFSGELRDVSGWPPDIRDIMRDHGMLRAISAAP